MDKTGRFSDFILASAKLIDFSGFIVTTFIMLTLVDNYLTNQALKWALLVLLFPLFHTFVVLPTFLETALLSLLFTLKYDLYDKYTEKISSLASHAQVFKKKLKELFTRQSLMNHVFYLMLPCKLTE